MLCLLSPPYVDFYVEYTCVQAQISYIQEVELIGA